jgi:uncharacterized membrane protein YesL
MNPLQNEQRRTPIGLFFYLLISKLLLFIILNLLFILTSIPLFTLPQSIYSLNKSVSYILSGGEESIIKVYFRSFRTDIFQSFVIGLLAIIILSGLGYAAFFYYLNSERWYYLFFFFLLVLLFIISYSIFMYSYLMLVSVKLPLKTILKNAIILTFSFPKETIFGSVGSLSILVLGAMYFPYSTPLLLLLIFSFSCFVSSFCCLSLIQKNIILKRQ